MERIKEERTNRKILSCIKGGIKKNRNQLSVYFKLWARRKRVRVREGKGKNSQDKEFGCVSFYIKFEQETERTFCYGRIELISSFCLIGKMRGFFFLSITIFLFIEITYVID